MPPSKPTKPNRKRKTTAAKKNAAKKNAAKKPAKKTPAKQTPKASNSWGSTAKARVGRVKKAAEEALRDPDRLKRLASDASAKANRRKGKIGEVADYLKAFIRLIRAYANGSYRAIPMDTMGLIVGAVIYFLIPTDAIPDFIPGAGYLDDAGVIAFVLVMVKDEIDEFIDWEKKHGGGGATAPAKK